MYDTDTIQQLGTSVSNPYFIEDCAKEDLESEFQASFVCDDGSRLTLHVPDDILMNFHYEFEGDWKNVDLRRSCSVDAVDADGNVKRYVSDQDRCALDAYLEDHPDVKALDAETYGHIVFNEKLAQHTLDTKLRCQGILRGIGPQDEFDAQKYCQIIDMERDLTHKASQLGISTWDCPIAHTLIDIDRGRLQKGLFADNMEIDEFSDMYKDAYGVRPRHLIGREVSYISQPEEQTRKSAVDRVRQEQSMHGTAKNLSPVAGAACMTRESDIEQALR